jgi:transposase-like protein
LIEAVELRASASDAVALIDCRFAAAPRCPHCQSVDVGTPERGPGQAWSKPKPLTRYKCHACGKAQFAILFEGRFKIA